MLCLLTVFVVFFFETELAGAEHQHLWLAVSFYGDGYLIGSAQVLKNLQRLLRVGQRRAVDIFDEIAGSEPQRGELFSIAAGIDAVTLLLSRQRSTASGE